MKPFDAPRHWAMIDRQLLRTDKRAAAEDLPADWLPIINAEAQRARSYHMRHAPADPVSARKVWRGYMQEFGGAAAAQLTDGQIKAQARAYANEAGDLDVGLLMTGGHWQEYDRLVTFCRRRDVEPPPPVLLLKGMGARVRCQYWWRRALRRMVARKCERGYLAMGLVSSHNRQPYASDKSVLRRLDQNARNRSSLENTFMENDEGYCRSLAELAATSVSNKTIRRGELMTRIRGCEQIAMELGHPGIFATLTAPSRFHSTKYTGKRNPKYDGSTPRDAQIWLRDKWVLARSKLLRLGIKVYGFRVAEPHHDGCTHWHMLIWSAGDLDKWQEVVRDYWLSDDGAGQGAQKYRVNFKAMEAGGAAGYIAKYISKNIDDHCIDSHHDDFGEPAVGPDLLGDLEIKPALRVEAWASTWGIRQFQPLGQPPVTVWRELRRITEKSARAAGFNGVVHKAWLAAQKIGGELADWARYVKAQGGLMLGRACRLVMRHDVREVETMYGASVRPIVVGVALNCTGSRTVWSERRLWRQVERSASPRPDQAARSARPRTGVNNCTVLTLSAEVEAIRQDAMRGPGGSFKAPAAPSPVFTVAPDRSGGWYGGSPAPMPADPAILLE